MYIDNTGYCYLSFGTPCESLFNRCFDNRCFYNKCVMAKDTTKNAIYYGTVFYENGCFVFNKITPDGLKNGSVFVVSKNFTLDKNIKLFGVSVPFGDYNVGDILVFLDNKYDIIPCSSFS